MVKLNKTWDRWIRWIKKIKEEEVEYADRLRGYDEMLNKFGIDTENKKEFELACVVISIVKWRKWPVVEPDSRCGLCYYDKIEGDHRRECFDCKLKRSIFNDKSLEYRINLCSGDEKLTKKRQEEILEKLHSYYKREYNNLYGKKITKNDKL